MGGNKPVNPMKRLVEITERWLNRVRLYSWVFWLIIPASFVTAALTWMEGPMRKWLPLIVTCIGLAVAIAGTAWSVIAKRSEEAPTVSESLSVEDQQFRLELRKFVLASLDSTVTEFVGLFHGMINITPRNDKRDEALVALITEMLVTNVQKRLLNLKSLVQSSDPNQINADAVQRQIKAFLTRYSQDQKFVPIYASAAGLSLKSLPWTMRWLNADASSRNTFRELKAFPSAVILREVDDTAFSSLRSEMAQP
jgi:hypothetical protein